MLGHIKPGYVRLGFFWPGWIWLGYIITSEARLGHVGPVW